MSIIAAVRLRSAVVSARYLGSVCDLVSRRHTSSSQGHERHTDSRSSLSRTVFGLAGAATVAWAVHHFTSNEKSRVHASQKDTKENFGDVRKDLPTYTLEEVSKHDTVEKKIWITYKRGVYDITQFIPKHPGGGDKIMMAAGGSVDPFWILYAAHNNPQVLSLLEEYRIGNLSEEESQIAIRDLSDPYAMEPRRHPALQPRSLKPYNAEPPPALLVDSFVTPQDLFFVRNHLPVPEIDVANYQLELEGMGIRKKTLTLAQIKKMPKYTITAVVQCTGNRRSEMTEVKPVKGLNWGQAAIGNARWSGVRLRDVLLAVGLKDDQKGVEHIHFEGLDVDVSNIPYAASIPVDIAMDPRGDVMLAYEMNGEPLSRDHGFPLRVIVPGVVGARNVKWLGRIIVSGVESDSHWQQRDYKGFSPSVDWDNVDFDSAPAVQEAQVTSAICDPQPGQTVTVKDGKIQLRGYAWSGGGRGIVRVDVTADQGRSWHVAELHKEPAKHNRHWGWTTWRIDIPVPADARTVEVWTKAVDSSYNVQPESFANIWNLRGVLSNAYHRVKVNLQR